MAYVQSTDPVNNGNPDSTHVTAAYVSNNTAGNTLFAFVTWDTSSGGTLSVADTQGNTWATVSNAADAPNTQRGEVWAAFNCKSGANTVTATLTANGGSRGMICAEYGASAGVDKHAEQFQSTNTGAADNITSTAATTTSNGEDIAGFVVYSSTPDGNAFSAGTGYTLRQHEGANFYAFESQTQSTAGSIAATFTRSSADTRFCTFMIALLPSGSAPAADADATAAAFTPGIVGPGIVHDQQTIATAFTSTGNQTVSHAGSPDARAACVIIDQNGTVTDEVSGVTYAGVSMTRVRFDTEATEAGGDYIYWLDGITGGTQNVVMTTTASTNKQMTIYTMAVDAGCVVAVEASGTGTSASVANPSWNVVTATGVHTVLYEGIHSGLTTMTNTPASGWTLVSSTDLGAEGRGFARRTATGGTVAAGWIAATADDFVGNAVAFREAALPSPTDADATAAAFDATVTTSSGGGSTNAPAADADATADGQTASIAVTVTPADADATAAAQQSAIDIKVNAVDAAATAAGQTASISITVNATDADATAAGQQPAIDIKVNAVDSAATATAFDATVSTANITNAPAADADATADGQTASIAATSTPADADAVAAAQGPSTAITVTPAEGAASAAAQQPSIDIKVNAVDAAATATAFDATVSTASFDNAPAADADATADAPQPSITITVPAGQGAATADAPQPLAAISPQPAEGASTATAQDAIITLTVGAAVATTTAAAFDATVQSSVPGVAHADIALATASAFDAMVCIGVARPFTGNTTYPTATTARPGSGTTTYATATTPRPDTGETEGPC